MSYAVLKNKHFLIEILFAFTDIKRSDFFFIEWFLIRVFGLAYPSPVCELDYFSYAFAQDVANVAL